MLILKIYIKENESKIANIELINNNNVIIYCKTSEPWLFKKERYIEQYLINNDNILNNKSQIRYDISCLNLTEIKHDNKPSIIFNDNKIIRYIKIKNYFNKIILLKLKEEYKNQEFLNIYKQALDCDLTYCNVLDIDNIIKNLEDKYDREKSISLLKNGDNIIKWESAHEIYTYTQNLIMFEIFDLIYGEKYKYEIKNMKYQK